MLRVFCQITFGDYFTQERTACGWWARVGNNLTFSTGFGYFPSSPCPTSLVNNSITFEDYWMSSPPTSTPQPQPSVRSFLGLHGVEEIIVIVTICVFSLTVFALIVSVALGYFSCKFCRLRRDFKLHAEGDYSINQGAPDELEALQPSPDSE